MNTNKSLRSNANDAAQASESAMEHTRHLAAQALERASEHLRDVSTHARDFASRGMTTVSDTAAVAQRRLGRYADATGRYVSDQPMRSALIAASVGALITVVLLTARRRSRRQF